MRRTIRGCPRSSTLGSNRRLAGCRGSQRHRKWRPSTTEGSIRSNLGNAAQRESSEGNTTQQARAQSNKGAEEQRGAAAREEAAGAAEAREGHLYKTNSGADVPCCYCHNVQARAACVQAVQHGNIQGIRQGGQPDTRLACLQLRLILMTTRPVSPKWGCSNCYSATNHEIIFVDLWAMSSTSCGKRAAMHCL